MPLMYLAKVNLNSRIFDIYNKNIKIGEVCESIYKNFDVDYSYKEEQKCKYLDELGNPQEYTQTSDYTLKNIEKMLDTGDRVITGKISRKYNKRTEDEEGKVVYNTERSSIYFYYNVDKEMVVFRERQSFGYNQFMNAFTKILNSCASDYIFEMFLQKDSDMLVEKIGGLKSVTKVKAVLIPPNSNEDDLKELRDQLKYMQQCQDMNATKITMEYSSEDMNMESNMIKEIITATSRGYGDFTATGVTSDKKVKTIKSNQDAAFTLNISEGVDNDMFNKEAKGFISSVITKIKNKIRV